MLKTLTGEILPRVLNTIRCWKITSLKVFAKRRVKFAMNNALGKAVGVQVLISAYNAVHISLKTLALEIAAIYQGNYKYLVN